MVYGSMILVKANALFSPLEGFDPAYLLDMLEEVKTIAQAADILGMEGIVPPEFQQPLMDFLETIPPSIDAATLAATRSALERGLPRRPDMGAGVSLRAEGLGRQQGRGRHVGRPGQREPVSPRPRDGDVGVGIGRGLAGGQWTASKTLTRRRVRGPHPNTSTQVSTTVAVASRSHSGVEYSRQ